MNCIRLLPGVRGAVVIFGLALTIHSASAQTFQGTNQPGTASDFAFTVGAASTNLSVAVNGSLTTFSHLLLKAGAPPSDTNYDFIAAQDGVGNSINLELPQLLRTSYIARVRTPANSAVHVFTLTVTTNVNNLRQAARPATKPLQSTSSGSLTASSWHYYRVEIPADLPGWRVVLTSTNSGPDLYVQRDALPTTATYLERSQLQTNDLIAFAPGELIPGAYFIGVYQPSGSSAYTLKTETITFTTLNWDSGLTHLGTQVYTNQSTNGGSFYFKITAQNTALSAWRTALNVTAGEADIYLSKGTPPAPGNSVYDSSRPGSDGFVVPSSAFAAGEDWYYLVQAQPGSQWTLVTGEPHVMDLGTVAGDGSSDSGIVAIGAESFRFFKTTVSVGSPAWRLYLNGRTNSVLVKKSGVPLPGVSDLSQSAQMLVVPPYLVGGQLYFVGVSGAPGEAIKLDSRPQLFEDIAFVTSTNLTVSGYGYRTFRVQVPPDQLAWQVNMVVSNGNPNLAVRRNFIPNEFYNDAFSEIASNVTDSITLVPPTLSDGTFFITVYGASNYSGTLRSGNPEFTEINFVSQTLNTDTNRTGWRFFKVSNIAEQLGALGWDLFVTNHTPGTRIALRRNAAPGIWNFRNPTPGVGGTVDYLSPAEFLQRPGHQADVWYVGVFNTNAPLGGFTLVAQELTAEPVAFNNGSSLRADVPPGKWQYFRVDVPTGVLGWDVRLVNVIAGSPQLVVRRELLPVSLQGIGFSGVITATNWPSGNQWVAGADWTGRNLSSDGNVNESGRILTMGYGRPLETATYYIGVISPASATNAMSYTLSSRGIGDGLSIPVTDLSYSGGETNGTLPARDIAVYRITVGSNAPSWKVKLTPAIGDALMAVSRGSVPNITATLSSSVTNIQAAGRRVAKAGNEHFVQLPPALGSNILGGPYYILVASDGQPIPGNTTQIGTSNASYTLKSFGRMPEVDLGLLTNNPITNSGTLDGGESIALHFHNEPYPDTLGFELRLEDSLGNPAIVSRGDMDLANPGAASVGGGSVPADPYGNEGGKSDGLQASFGIINVSGALADETVMVKARPTGGTYPDAAYTLHIRKLVPQPLAFNGGVATSTGQTNLYEYFEVEVPTNALGWDLRLTNVTGSASLSVSPWFLPLNIIPSGWNPGTDEFWPAGANWIPTKDWTQRSFSAGGGPSQDGSILACGMGRPLEPGKYYVAVYNGSSPAPASWTLISRGIGDGFAIPVVDLPFDGGSVTNLGLAPREAAYYRVVVPSGASSWQAKLTTLTGESMLVALTNSIPSILTGQSSSAGKAMLKSTNEHFLRLPLSGQTELLPGTNYLAVISEGVTNAAFPSRIGTGTSSYVLESRGPLAVVNLGEVSAQETTHTGSLEGGEVRAYQFTVPAGVSSLETRLYTSNGVPAMVLRVGSLFPNPGAATTISGAGSVGTDTYGNEGGQTITAANGDAKTNLITVANPSNGVYTVMVKARALSASYPSAAYTLGVRALTYLDVAFDGGLALVTNHAPNTWRYYRLEVPTNTLGWDLRLLNVTAGLPKLVVRRDILPSSLTTTPWSNPGVSTNWPTTNQWAASADWTRRPTSADGLVNEDGRILAMGQNQPLDPGTYWIGVINSAGTNAMSYSLFSRGIGENLSIPVADLNYAGGSVSITNLPPREAAYFRVQVPESSPGWKLRLKPTSGEAMLLLLSNSVPNVDSGRNSHVRSGKALQKAGKEHHVLLPFPGQTNIIPGTYYLAVVSEGLNPASANHIGSDASSFTLTSVGDVPIVDLGTISLVEMARAETLDGGESQFFRFTVPPTAPAIEMRLENRIGHPVMVLLTNSALVDPAGPVSGRDPYGNDGGVTPNFIGTNIITVANPAPGTFMLAVKARALNSVYPDAAYTLRVRQLPVPELNFTAEFNTNGLNNTASGLLLDAQRAYYKVVVPADVHGRPVIGWELNLSQLSGVAAVRARQNELPSDTLAGMPLTPNAAALVTPFLTTGTWFVEVRGSNSTAFTLVSSTIALQRPAWAMPALGQTNTAPGLTLPDFGDSGVDTNGTSLPGDQGIDLELGQYHFYAAVVPTNNGGLLRVQLDAISGNPDLYVRVGEVPTASHRTNGQTGTIFDRSLVGSTTEYGNFVPLDGKQEIRLTPDLWYFAVRAVANANARYRLKLSTGTVQELALDGGNASGQNLAGGDWRYYRLQIPETFGGAWNVNFSQDLGDVVMHVRDTVPPGNGATTNATEYRDWTSDAKNNATYGSYDAPGNYAFAAPPVRPGSAYYLGFRAKNDAVFSVSSSASGGTNALPPVIEFYGGFVTNTIAPGNQVAYRILTPGDALRWRHTSVHSNNVNVYIANGSYPAKNAQDHFRSTVANSSNDRMLTNYPWLPLQTYYLIATNPSAVPLPFSLTMNGSRITDDSDGDGMPDGWEVQHFGGLTQTAAGDYDGDGVNNLTEYQDGTNPADPTSVFPRLTVIGTNGVVDVNPSAPSYSYGAVVTLTATPNPGYDFVGWALGASGTANPWVLTLTSSRTVLARFRVPGDDFDQRILLIGQNATQSGLSNTNATKQTGEPNHAGNSGGRSLWWTWTAPLAGPVTITTAGTTMRNMVAVYTGNVVNGLTVVTNHLAGAGTTTATVSFNAFASTTYQIAVDGYLGAAGSVTINVAMANPLVLTNPQRLANGLFNFTVLGSPGQALWVEASTNLTGWSQIATVTNVTGSLEFTDPATTNSNRRYYRAVLPPP